MEFPEVRMSRKKKAIVISSLVLTVVAIPPLFLYVYLPFVLSGGIEGMRKRRIPAPDLKNPTIINRRTSMKNDIEATFKVLDTVPGFTRYAIATHDQCYQGEANWKIVDSYAHRCEFRATHFYGFNGDFQAQMIKFEMLLNHHGWTSPDHSSIQRILTDYNDLHRGYRVPAVRMRKHLVSDLPTPGPYRQNGLTMVVGYAEKETDDLIRLDLIQKIYTSLGTTTNNVQELQDVKAVFGEITRSCRYVLAISIDGTYFEN
jgi:hypothetical protein